MSVETGMPHYYGNWKEASYNCKSCLWTGYGRELRQGELYEGVIEFRCPACRKLMIEVALPTLAESRANWDRLSAGDRKFVERIEAFQANFERHKLKSGSQLPDIADSSFVLDWDTVESSGLTFIKHGENVIFSEPAVYQGYERFIEVAGILRSRYGRALQDLRPTRQSWLYLYGDSYQAPGKVSEARKKLFPNAAVQG